MRDVYLNWIDGGWAEGGAGRMTIENPGTGEALAQQAVADARDVDRAVQAAARVHRSGALTALRPVERARMVQAMGAHLLANLEDLARLLCLEQGKTLWEARAEIRDAARYFEYYGNQADALEGRQIPLGSGYVDFTLLEPYGVSAQIIPWNFPMEIAARSIAAGLATGNACVVKTSEVTPLTSHVFGPAAEAAGLPPGAVNILSGYGAEAGAALAGHPGVNQIVFTGSVATGIAIAAAAAHTIVPCVLELGGKSAAIVWPDADLAAFETDVRKGIFINAGPDLFGHEPRRGAPVGGGRGGGAHRGAGAVDRRRTGHRPRHADAGHGRDGECPAGGPGRGSRDPCDRGRRPDRHRRAPAEPAGPLHGTHGPDPRRSGQRNGADGGVRPRRLRHGLRDEDEAIAIANGTEYGLVAGVFTRDLNRATSAARRLRAGQVFVNEWFAGGVETPFGGMGKSGYGREKGREALRNYVQTKNVAIRLG